MTPTEAEPADTLTLHDNPRERGTRYMFGKPYHWGTRNGQLVLLAGPDPRTTEFEGSEA